MHTLLKQQYACWFHTADSGNMSEHNTQHSEHCGVHVLIAAYIYIERERESAEKTCNILSSECMMYTCIYVVLEPHVCVLCCSMCTVCVE